MRSIRDWKHYSLTNIKIVLKSMKQFRILFGTDDINVNSLERKILSLGSSLHFMKSTDRKQYDENRGWISVVFKSYNLRKIL